MRIVKLKKDWQGRKAGTVLTDTGGMLRDYLVNYGWAEDYTPEPEPDPVVEQKPEPVVEPVTEDPQKQKVETAEENSPVEEAVIEPQTEKATIAPKQRFGKKSR
jgi:hypothetical protein